LLSAATLQLEVEDESFLPCVVPPDALSINFFAAFIAPPRR
jgi:hypothetical protein